MSIRRIVLHLVVGGVLILCSGPCSWATLPVIDSAVLGLEQVNWSLSSLPVAALRMLTTTCAAIIACAQVSALPLPVCIAQPSANVPGSGGGSSLWASGNPPPLPHAAAAAIAPSSAGARPRATTRRSRTELA